MRSINHIITACCFLISLSAFSQIGIETNIPSPDSYLDINTPQKGLLLPRVALPNFNSFLGSNTSHTESLLVYNSNSTLGSGFTMWKDSKWNHLNSDFFWGTYGSDNTVSGTGANYLGTQDLHPFILGTHGLPKLHIGITRQLASQSTGTIASPAWAMHQSNLGISLLGTDLILSNTNGNVLELSSNNSTIVLNKDRSRTPVVINGVTDEVLYVDNVNDRIALNHTSSVASTLHMQGANNRMRIDGLSNLNPMNNGVDNYLLNVDASGQFKLEVTPQVTQLPQFLTDLSFLPTGYTFDSATLGQQTQLLFSTNQVMHKDALIEVIFQSSVAIRRNSTGGPVVDGKPRLFGIRVKINGRIIGSTSKAYSSAGISSGGVAGGFMFLNGKGYIPVTGTTAGSNYLIEVEAFVDGGGESSFISFGTSGNDLLEVLLHY